MSRCFLCNHEHPGKNQDPLSCGMCKTCGMVLCGRRLTLKSAGKVYAFCCAKCRDTYRRMASVMRKRLRHGEITEKEFRDFERDIVI